MAQDTIRGDGHEGPLATRMLTVKEVAHLLHVHANTIRRWSECGLLKSYRLGRRGDRRFSWDDVISFLGKEAKGQPPAGKL